MITKIWSFCGYVAQSGRQPAHDWYDALPPEAQAEFDTAKRFLEVRTRNESPGWRRPYFDMLTGKKYREIGEIRFQSANVTYRPFGCFIPDKMQFVILVGTQKKGNVYDPKNAQDTAVRRKKDLDQNPGERIHAWNR